MTPKPPPLCFILLPSAKQPTGDGQAVDYDAIYSQLIKPAVEIAGLVPVRPVGSLAESLFDQARLAQLLDDFPDIQRLKTDVFRDSVRYAEDLKARLAAARAAGADAVAAVETGLGDIGRADAAVVIDLFLSYRAVKAWDAMVSLVPRMAPPLAATTLVREQLALSLNRAGQSEEAEAVLLKLIAERGASSETCSILGRVYKDRWNSAVQRGESMLASGLLDKAIGAYLRGFEADWRDAFPGVNAVTLMELKEPPDPRQAALLPVVTYAVGRRITACQADYWDHATRLELAVLARNTAAAEAALADALTHLRESWEAETTACNLNLIAIARRSRGEDDSTATRAAMALARATETHRRA